MPARRLILLILIGLAIAPYFLNLNATSIIDANEAFYAETPREMIEAGDYINPTFNYEPRFNKPPLSYWVVAGIYRVFGVSLGSARLPIALGSLVILATVFLLGRAVASTEAGLVAVVTLAATPRFLLFSRRIIIDIYTAAFLGLTLLFFVLAETDPPRRRRYLVAMYVAMSLGILTKGPVALALPALVVAVYLMAAGRLRTVTRLMLPAGLLIGAVIVVPYYAALYAQHGWDDIVTFLVRENLARYAEGVGAPDRGPFFYLPVVLADLYFPWSLILPAALALVPWTRVWTWRGWTGIWGEPAAAAASATRDDLRLLYGLWMAVIVVFFSLSKGQQDLYVLPFVATGAPLVGAALDGLFTGTLGPRVARATYGSVALIAVVLAVLGALVAWFIGASGDPIHIAGARAAGVALVVGSAAGFIALIRCRVWSGAMTLVGTVIVGLWILVWVALPDFERYKPVPHLARTIDKIASAGAPVGTYHVATPSLVFYLRRHVYQMFDPVQVQTFFRVHPEAYCLMRDDDYAVVGPGMGIPTRVVVAAPYFEARLRHFLDRSPLPNLVIVTNRMPQPQR